jgi:MFS family permease
VLAVLCIAVFAINVDTTIVNVALPTLVKQLGASTSNLQWIVDAYNLTFAALVLAAGSLSDRFDRKGALVVGLVIFGVATTAGAFGTTTSELIVARVVMGIGAAIIFPNTLSILSNVFPDRTERAKAIGAWGATTGMAVAFGPIIGGWLLEHFWWRSVFLAMAPAAAIAVVLVIVLYRLPGTRPLPGSTVLAWPCPPPRSVFSSIRSSRPQDAVGARRARWLDSPAPPWPSRPSSCGNVGSQSRCSMWSCSRIPASQPPAAPSRWPSSLYSDSSF